MEVRDEGRGIPVGQRSAALEPFMRINQEGSGTGLGLHLVGQTAELHGASLEMEDLEPSGFAVRLVWPQGR
jgi:signal transduction histidine kinase